jgi:hypothetical protein
MRKIPDGMIQLMSLPVGEDGAPIWNDEINAATKRLGPSFLAPFMVEVSPGMAIGGYVARASFDTSVRTYEAKATLIVRNNDELRTSVLVTAPGVRDERNGAAPWKPYGHEYKASLPKIHLDNIVHTIRGLCEQSHAKELLMRDQSPAEGGVASSSNGAGAVSHWQVEGGGPVLHYKLTRTYDRVPAKHPNDPATTISIRVSLTGSKDNNSIDRVLRIHLRPFRVPKETLVMGLFTADQAFGGFVEVHALPVPSNAPRDLLDAVLCVHKDDVTKCLRALSSGRDLILALTAPAKPDAEPFVELLLKSALTFELSNDLEFKLRHDHASSLIEKGQDATRARHLREGWYRRRPVIE